MLRYKLDRGPDDSDEYLKCLNTEISTLEDLYSDSLIVIKTDIMNQALFYCKEIGVSAGKFTSTRAEITGSRRRRRERRGRRCTRRR